MNSLVHEGSQPTPLDIKLTIDSPGEARIVEKVRKEPSRMQIASCWQKVDGSSELVMNNAR